jgi:isopentenyldiphosphate isomerase
MTDRRHWALLVVVITFIFIYVIHWRMNTKFEEFVDLSDYGEIGSKVISIEKVHIRGLKHRGSWVLILNEDESRMLFLKRSSTTVTCPNTWCFLGEHTKRNESYLDAALRGINEELHLQRHQILSSFELPGLDLIHLEYAVPYRRIDHQWTKTFVIKIPAAKIQLDASEATGFLWIPVNESIAWISHCEDPIEGKLASCRSCTEASYVYIIRNETTKINYKYLVDVMVEKIQLYLAVKSS